MPETNTIKTYMLSLQTRPDLPWNSPSLHLNGYQGSFQWVKWPDYDVDLSPSSGSKVENDWSLLYLYSISVTLWHVCDNFTVTFVSICKFGWKLILIIYPYFEK